MEKALVAFSTGHVVQPVRNMITIEEGRRYLGIMPAIAEDVMGLKVVCATNAHEPILRGTWLKPGAHVNAVGAPRPTWRELDDEVMGNLLVVDSREAVMKESGDVILSNAKIHAEIGEIFAGTKPSPVSQTTIFKSVGIAVEDIAAANLVFKKASEAKTR